MHAQVVGGLFDARGVDLDALYDVDMNQLSVNVRYPSKVSQDEFTSKIRNSKGFYQDEDLAETNTTPVDNNEANEDLAEANVAPTNGNDHIEVVGREGENEIFSDHEWADNML